jgi:hypothetical protein
VLELLLLPMGEVDPNTVRPGWVALLIVIGLGGATFLLWRSMGHQLKKIRFDPDDEKRDAPPEPSDPRNLPSEEQRPEKE